MAYVRIVGNILKKLLNDIAGDRIEWAGEKKDTTIDLMVINSINGSIKDDILLLDNHSLILANIDLKDILKDLNGSRGVIVTYGFNGKACVTASSVTENEIQVCIQRGIKNIKGEMIEEQEFSVETMRSKDVYGVLGAVTAALLLGMNVSEIRESSSKMVNSE